MIFNYLIIYKTRLFILQEFLADDDPHAVTMRVNIGSSIDAPPMSDTQIIKTNTLVEPHMETYAPPEQHTSGSAHDVVDPKHDIIAQFEVRFRRYSHIISTRTLQITILIDDEIVPMKIEKLLGI